VAPMCLGAGDEAVTATDAVSVTHPSINSSSGKRSIRVVGLDPSQFDRCTP